MYTHDHLGRFHADGFTAHIPPTCEQLSLQLHSLPSPKISHLVNLKVSNMLLACQSMHEQSLASQPSV